MIAASASMEVDGIEDELSRTKEEFQQQKDLLDTAMSKLQITEQKLQQVCSNKNVNLFIIYLNFYLLYNVLSDDSRT